MNKGRTGEIEQALLETIAQNFIDNSCKNISVERTRIVQTDSDIMVKFWGYYFEYQYYVDNGDVQMASHAKPDLVALKPGIPAALWKSLNIDTPITADQKLV
jgi:hypothetical protein